MLHDEHDITLFLFQDDDFPVYGAKWRQWARDFCDELHRVGLAGRILWKISCRADAVDADLFARMRDSGLYLVYMGLESGHEAGLVSLNKSITVDQTSTTYLFEAGGLSLSIEFGSPIGVSGDMVQASRPVSYVRATAASLQRLRGSAPPARAEHPAADLPAEG